MAIPATCPRCESTIRASDKYAGKRVKCPGCGEAMVVPQADEPSRAATSPQDAALAASGAGTVELSAPIPPLDEAARAGEPQESARQDGPAVVEHVAEDPVVRISDDGEHWRKAVAKKKPSRAKQTGSSAWLWLVVGVAALVVVVVVAGGLAFWKLQPSKMDVAISDPPPEVARTESISNINTSAVPPGTSLAIDDVAESETVTADRSTETLEELSLGGDEESATASASGNGNNAAATMSGGTRPAEDMREKDAGEMREVASASSTPADPEEEVKNVVLDRPAEKVLEEHGIRIVGEQAALIDESTTELRTALREAQKLKTNLGRSFTEAMKLEKLQKDLKAEYGVRSAALAQVNATRPNDATTNNVLVGQLSAIKTRVEQLDEQIETARRKLAESREAYIEHLLKTRGTVEKVQNEYEQASADPEVKAALAQLSKEKQTEFTLEPLGSFYRAQQDLTKLEEQILSDRITARVESGNLFVSTMINGEHTIEMIVDSGASVVTLPYEMAVAAGVKPKASDPVAQFQIADGSLISGQMITIPSLRVGKFTVENVEAAVLDPKAISATPLLGMSFLGKFETKIDSERGQLVLSKVEGTEDSQRVR